MNRDYAELCERMWQRWLAGEIEPSTEVQRHFDVDAVPEPYLIFGDTSDPLVVVTTNPGATMEHQRRDTILHGDSPVTPRMRYSDVAREMARWYQDHLSGAAATRIRAQIDLATACGFTGVVQVECLPWHSDRLPKPRALQVMHSDEESSAYVRALEAQIEGAPTIALSAVHSGTDFLAPSLHLSDWLSWQMSYLNIDVDEAVRIPLVTKGGRPTSMALCQKSSGSPRALVLMMGGNHFPSRSNLTPLVEWLSARQT